MPNWWFGSEVPLAALGADPGQSEPTEDITCSLVHKLAVISMHTSPLAQPGIGDGGGMNVYVRQLSSALARRGISCDVYTRASSPANPAVVEVEPGLTVHHVPAGPLGPLPKADLAGVVEEFAAALIERIDSDLERPDALHANYWLSGVAGHICKHELSLPLVSTFHTLERAKWLLPGHEEIDEKRAAAEEAVIACSDVVLASCDVEAQELVSLYGAPTSRLSIVAPGVEHAFFAPGDKRQARRALGMDPEKPLMLFAGRIQPLKGADTAVSALSLSRVPDATLAIVGGPSGPHGAHAMAELRANVKAAGLSDRVRFVSPQPHGALSTWYRAADVCLVPSRSESFGLVALEAAACGIPVVASAVGGLTTLVENGRTGFLVKDPGPLPFALGADRIMTDPALAGRMRSEALRKAAGFTWRSAAETLSQAIDSVIEGQVVLC